MPTTGHLRLVESDEKPLDEAEALAEALRAVLRIERSPLIPDHAQQAVHAFIGLLRRYVERSTD